MTSETGRPPRAIKKGDFVRKHENDRPRFVDRLEYDARQKIEVAIVVDTVNEIWERIPPNELILAHEEQAAISGDYFPEPLNRS